MRYASVGKECWKCREIAKIGSERRGWDRNLLPLITSYPEHTGGLHLMELRYEGDLHTLYKYKDTHNVFILNWCSRKSIHYLIISCEYSLLFSQLNTLIVPSFHHPSVLWTTYESLWFMAAGQTLWQRIQRLKITEGAVPPCSNLSSVL